MSDCVLITGSAKRLGRHIAIRFAKNGHDIILHYNSSESEAIALANELKSIYTIKAVTVKAPLSGEESAYKLAESSAKTGLSPSILVHNASFYPEISFADTKENDVSQMIEIHVNTPLFLTKACMELFPKMLKSIVFLHDTSVSKNPVNRFAYQLSKKSGYNLMRMMAKELAPNIRVNGIAPGPVLSPHNSDNSFMEERVKRTAMKRAGTPEDVAEAVYWLSHQPYLTGNILYVDGGEHIV